MTQKEPLFFVGEDVYICPEKGGKYEAVVTSREFGSSLLFPELSPYTGYGYHVEPDPRSNSLPWAEHALRKRPKPGLTKKELMRSLKKPVTA